MTKSKSVFQIYQASNTLSSDRRHRLLFDRRHRLLVTAGIDDAKAVALGIGENHEIRIGFVPVPVDALGAESDQALHLGGLIGGVAGVQVRVYPGMILGRRFAPG